MASHLISRPPAPLTMIVLHNTPVGAKTPVTRKLPPHNPNKTNNGTRVSHLKQRFPALTPPQPNAPPPNLRGKFASPVYGLGIPTGVHKFFLLLSKTISNHLRPQTVDQYAVYINFSTPPRDAVCKTGTRQGPANGCRKHHKQIRVVAKKQHTTPVHRNTKDQ